MKLHNSEKQLAMEKLEYWSEYSIRDQEYKVKRMKRNNEIFSY